MPIRKVMKQVRAGSTYDGIGGKVKIEEQSEFDLENNMGPSDMLIDPEDDEPGYLYTENATKVKAGAKKVKASPQNVGTIPNDVNPAKGYLENASDFDTDVDAEEDLIDGEVDEEVEVEDGEVIADELVNNDSAEQLVVADDWDAAPEDGDDDIELPEEVAVEVPVEPEDGELADDEMTMLDVDEVDDKDVGNLCFAATGTRLQVIRGNRIIASMTERAAQESGREDVYLTDQFAEAAVHEISAMGLRAGLKSMGLVEARVKVGGSAAVKSLVSKQVNKTTAAVRQVANANAEAMDQALAIASVGINRGYFAKQNNLLRDELEAMMTTAGIRNAKRALNPIFASVGPAYAKQVLTLAQKIAAMPQEARDGYVEALDLTSEDIDEPDEDVVPIGADEEDFDDVAPATLATAGVKRRVVQAGTMSPLASSILNGNAPLF